jgi:hypothetical protein
MQTLSTKATKEKTDKLVFIKIKKRNQKTQQHFCASRKSIKKVKASQLLVAHACDPETRKIVLLRPAKPKKVCKTPSQQKKAGCSGVCHHLRDDEKPKIRGSQYRLAWAESKMLSLKTSRQKGLKAWLKQYSTCLASVKY